MKTYSVFRNRVGRVFCLVSLCFVAPLIVGCGDNIGQTFEPGALNETQQRRYEISCVVRAVESQQERREEIESFENCQTHLPRLTRLHSELREAWEDETRDEWQRRCEQQSAVVQPTCFEKMEKALVRPPAYLRIPPEHNNGNKRSRPVSDPIWRQALAEKDIRKGAALIIMEKVERADAMKKALSSSSTNLYVKKYSGASLSQRQKDLGEIRIGGCSIWIGRSRPDDSILSDHYLEQEITACTSR